MLNLKILQWVLFGFIPLMIIINSLYVLSFSYTLIAVFSAIMGIALLVAYGLNKYFHKASLVITFLIVTMSSIPLLYDAYVQMPFNQMSFIQNVIKQLLGSEKGMIYFVFLYPFSICLLLFNAGFYLRK